MEGNLVDQEIGEGEVGGDCPFLSFSFFKVRP